MYTRSVEKKTSKTYKLSPVTLRYLDSLGAATGNTSTSLVEMSVALFYRELFGVSALRSSEPSPIDSIPSPVDGDTQDDKKRKGTDESSSIKQRREALQLSRVAVAQAAGVSEGTVRRFENGQYKPHLINDAMIAKMARGLQWSEEETSQALKGKRQS